MSGAFALLNSQVNFDQDCTTSNVIITHIEPLDRRYRILIGRCYRGAHNRHELACRSVALSLLLQFYESEIVFILLSSRDRGSARQ